MRGRKASGGVCEGTVVDNSFRRGLEITANFYTVLNKTKSKPRVRQKRRCKNLVVSTIFGLQHNRDCLGILAVGEDPSVGYWVTALSPRFGSKRTRNRELRHLAVVTVSKTATELYVGVIQLASSITDTDAKPF